MGKRKLSKKVLHTIKHPPFKKGTPPPERVGTFKKIKINVSVLRSAEETTQEMTEHSDNTASNGDTGCASIIGEASMILVIAVCFVMIICNKKKK